MVFFEQTFKRLGIFHGMSSQVIVEVDINPAKTRYPCANLICPCPQPFFGVAAAVAATGSVKSDISEVGGQFPR